MGNSVSIRYFILGLLARQPMSGYDIKRFLKSLSWLVDSPSFGSLYPALHALLEHGLATVEVLSRQDKPPRKIYSITEPGRQVLQDWIGQPVTASASLKAFLMRLILAEHLSQSDLIAHLRQRRTQVSTQRTVLEQTAEAIAGNENVDLGERLTLEYGMAVATAELAWLDRTLDRLSQQPLSVEALQGDFAASTASGTQVSAG